MLELLQGDADKERVLDGLQQVMAVKSHAVLPMMVPQLVAPPVNTRALATLASVAGPALNRHLTKVIPALVGAAAENMEEVCLLLEYVMVVSLMVLSDTLVGGCVCVSEGVCMRRVSTEWHGS